MKKITSAILGLSLALATAGLTFAAQNTNAQSTPATTTKTKGKKHHKQAKSTTSSAPATQNSK